MQINHPLVVVSDLHLRSSQDRNYQLFLNVLSRLGPGVKYLVLNGDIFDFYPNRHISRQQDLYKQPDYDPVGDFETRYGSSTERK